MPNEYRTRKIREAAYLAAEILVFMPFDLATAWIRDSVIPRFVKRKFPSLACRGYNYLFSKEPHCKIGERYEHKGLFEKICGHYNAETGSCDKFAKERVNTSASLEKISQEN
jgi:hypothetical protein